MTTRQKRVPVFGNNTSVMMPYSPMPAIDKPQRVLAEVVKVKAMVHTSS